MPPPRRPDPTDANAPGRLNHVLVDFENVPAVDLAAIGDEPVNVMLLIGEKQRRLDLKLVRQIHEHAHKVTLVEVGASGRNALDLVLAWHLGRSAERHPNDTFYVVSKDKDYDPLIRHLHGRGLEVTRVESFSTLPFLRPPRSAPAARRSAPAPAAAPAPAPARRPERAVTPPDMAPSEPALPRAAEDRFAKLVDRLQHQTKARPVRRKTLLSHINGFHGNQLSPAELEAQVATLEEQGVIRIDEKGRVTYPG